MIKYSLVCENGHEFESWFPSSDSFDTQARRGLIDCPHCSNKRISKALMAPRVSTARKKEARAEARARAVATAPMPVPAPAVPPPPVALLDEKHAELRAAIRELHDKVVASTEDVGKQFPEHARKMHDGDLPVRPIRGEATIEEAKELWEEGIPVLPIPPLPDDRN